MKDEEISRKRIKEINELCYQLHRAAQNAREFSKLDDESGINDHDNVEIVFDIFGTIVVWAAGVVGYISSITNDSYVLPPVEQMRDRAMVSLPGLYRVDIFDIAGFGDWYQKNSDRFPHIKRYLQTVDYLRLLGISYLTLHVMPKYAADKETQD